MPTHGLRSTYAGGGCRCEACTEAQRVYHRERRNKYRALGTIPPGGEHGESGYFNFGCRCKVCSAAGRLKNRADSQARKAKGLAPDDPRHGTLAGYTSWYCRCEPCSKAAKDHYQARYARKKERDADR